MSTSTQFQQLTKPTEASDLVDIDVLNANFDKLDKIGFVLCTNATRPTTNLFAGLAIYETDTKRFYQHNGTTWIRVPVGGPLGHINEVTTGGGVTLSSGALFEDTGCRITLNNTEAYAQKYRVTANARFNAATAVFGLYRVQPYNQTDGAAFGHLWQGHTSVAGGTGQIAGAASGVITVPAASSKVVSIAVTRVSGGAATDTTTSGSCSVDNLGSL